jgi:hypothetical protein
MRSTASFVESLLFITVIVGDDVEECYGVMAIMTAHSTARSAGTSSV